MIQHSACVEYHKQKDIGEAFVKSIFGVITDIAGSNGMKVLYNVVDLETGLSGNIVLRNITESFWLKVIETAEKKRVCALGTPGIGKTTSSCILIRTLLEKNKTVVYHVRTEQTTNFVYMFIPAADMTGKINVKVVPERIFSTGDSKIDNKAIYYVVDPGDTSDSCNPSVMFKGKVIIVASPDDGHWGESAFRKNRRGIVGTFLFFPVWTLFELLKARQYMRSHLTEEEIEARYDDVGGIPRHIFTDDDDDFANELKDQVTAINDLTEHQIRQLALGNIAAVQTFKKTQPKSRIMAYGCVDPNFENYTVAVVSRRVARLLVNEHIKVLWNVILDRGGARGTTTWQIFETYCHILMLGDCYKEYYDYMYHDGFVLQDITNTSFPPLQLGGCSDIKGTHDELITAAKRKENVVFYSFDRSYPQIDFVYRKENTILGFQVTIGKTHDCQPGLLMDAMEKTGSDHEFLLICLTYDTRYEKFNLKPANPFSATIPYRSFLTKNWTVTVVRVPSPDEYCGGRSKIVATNINEINYANIEVLEKLKVKEWQDIARASGLQIRGTKKELILRIRHHVMTTKEMDNSMDCKQQ